ncbi:uncharacterized protein LOC132747802 [Ruditapes philippinarum]|uniref:uncharacterized protein LOC132747802 n=1 Tax=Ruditapes philippinarum TaxID=129788 RepID=UPI00295C15B0|nr:uncharacterized protein LOC132747802 [Ruditapes philippinarum]
MEGCLVDCLRLSWCFLRYFAQGLYRLIEPQNEANSKQEDKTSPPSRRDSKEETKIHDEKTAAKMETNINLERTHHNDRSSVRHRTFLKKRTSTRKNENPYEKHDAVNQCSTMPLCRIETASENEAVKHNSRYLGISTSQKADKQRGKLINKHHTDLCSTKPKECNEMVKSCETIKRNELSDIITKKNYKDNISTSHLHSASASAFRTAFENKICQPRSQLKSKLNGHNFCNNDFLHSDKVKESSQPQIKPLPTEHKCITSCLVKSETETNKRPNRVTSNSSIHEKSVSTSRGKTLTSHLHSASVENNSVAASVSVSRAVYESKLYQPRSKVTSEFNGKKLCYNDFNSDIKNKPTCIHHDCFSQPQPCITSFHEKSDTETNQRPNKGMVTSMQQKPASTSRGKTSMQKVHIIEGPTRTQSGERNKRKIKRNRSIKKTYERFDESRLTLQSNNRQTFIQYGYKNKNAQSYSESSNCNSDWRYQGFSNSLFERPWRYKPSYNSIRRKKYRKTQLSSQNLDLILQFYTEKTTLAIDIKYETHKNIDGLLYIILTNGENDGRFSTDAIIEGSNAVGVKVGKADELDYSVDILINCQQKEVSDEPVTFEFNDDDIDSHDRNEVSSIFVNAGKRYFPDERRLLCPNPYVPYVPGGFKAVYVSRRFNKRFPNCCVKDRNRRLFLPYYLLCDFHDFVSNAVYGIYGVSLNRGVKGPAVSLTIQQDEGPNISVDITPKLTVPNVTMSVTDFGWPRRDTYKWLTEEKIDSVICQQIYLVPKGDKYWKISYANCENELLRDIDKRNTWRKACLRIMKKKLMQWKSKSTTGLKGISSYLLKTTLLWLCEILPEDKYWYKEKLANRYLNFLQEFAYRLHLRNIGEYFNPDVNLLEKKDGECIDELEYLLRVEIFFQKNFSLRNVFSIRRKKYWKTQLSSQNLDLILQFYSEKATFDIDIKNETHENINGLLYIILMNGENGGRFSTEAIIEGSNACWSKSRKSR